MAERKTATRKSRKHERFFQTHAEQARAAEAWYYRAREGIFGPFASREAAESDLANLIYRNPMKREQFVE